MTDSERRRLRGSVVLHSIAAAVFALLALSGGAAAAPGRYGLAVSFVIAGVAGGVGAAVIAVSVWRVQSGKVATDPVPGGAAAIERSRSAQRAARRTMAAAAVPVLMAGVVLAPHGLDRGFVISVAAGLAAALALFALLAGERLSARLQ